MIKRMNVHLEHIDHETIFTLFEGTKLVCIDEDSEISHSNVPSIQNKETKEKVTLKKLGGYEKKILIMVYEEHVPIISEENLAFLTNILTACKMGLNDVCIINFWNNGFTYTQLIEETNPDVFIGFGIPTQSFDLPFEIPLYKVLKFSNTQHVFAQSLAFIQTGIPADIHKKKTELWLCLKKIFSL